MNILNKKLNITNILKSEKNFKNKKYFKDIEINNNQYKDKYINLQKEFEKHQLIKSSEDLLKKIIESEYSSILNNEFLHSLSYKINYINENFNLENNKDLTKEFLSNINDNFNKIIDLKQEIINKLSNLIGNKGKCINIEEMKENNIILVTGNFLDEILNNHLNLINHNIDLIEYQENLIDENKTHLNNIKSMQKSMREIQIDNNNKNSEITKEKNNYFEKQLKLQNINFNQLKEEFNLIKLNYDNLLVNNSKEINIRLELNKKYQEIEKKYNIIKVELKQKKDEIKNNKIDFEKYMQDKNINLIELIDLEDKYSKLELEFKKVNDINNELKLQNITIDNEKLLLKQEIEMKIELFEELKKEKLKYEKIIKELNYKRDNGIKEIKRLTGLLEDQNIQNESIISINDTIMQENLNNLDPIKKEIYPKIKVIYKDLVNLIPLKDKNANKKLILIERNINEVICWLLENIPF